MSLNKSNLHCMDIFDHSKIIRRSVINEASKFRTPKLSNSNLKKNVCSGIMNTIALKRRLLHTKSMVKVGQLYI